MSWWDSSNFSNFASSALKNAQKKIDKVLDIKEEGDDVDTSNATVSSSVSSSAVSSSSPSKAQQQVPDKTTEGKTENKSFSEFDSYWNNWFDGSSPQEAPATSLSAKTAKLSTRRTLSSSKKEKDSVNKQGISLSTGGDALCEEKPLKNNAVVSVRHKRGPLKLVVSNKSVEKSQVSSEADKVNLDKNVGASNTEESSRPCGEYAAQAHENIPDKNSKQEPQSFMVNTTKDDEKCSLENQLFTPTETSSFQKDESKQEQKSFSETDSAEALHDTDGSPVEHSTKYFGEEETGLENLVDDSRTGKPHHDDGCDEEITNIVETQDSSMTLAEGSSGKEDEHQSKVIPEQKCVSSPLESSGEGMASAESETTLCESSEVDHLEGSAESIDIAPTLKMEHLDSSMMSSVSSDTYVKCSVDEAMNDVSKHEDNDSHSSLSEPSDLVKIDSGHTSGDEIDTTTSSDIEIISNPTPTSDINRPFDFSPLRHALHHSMQTSSNSHRRNDSSDSSGHSRFGETESLSPGSNEDDHHEKDRTHRMKTSAFKPVAANVQLEVKVDDPNDPMNPQKLLRTTQLQNNGDLAKKLADMAEILEAREQKLIMLSKENLDLQECKSILRNQLEQAEQAHEEEMTDLNQLTEEFTHRISEAERKLQQTLMDKDVLRKQLTVAQEELAKKTSGSSSAQKLIKEKDEQIAELLSEGEKLSKQQLQGNNIIKKLRAKEKDNDGLLKTQKEKLETQTTEIDHLKTVLDSKEEMEKKQRDAIKQLNSAVKKQEKEILKLKSDLEDSVEKSRSMQVALDNSYKEIAELHKKNATYDSKAQEASLSAEVTAKEELRLSLEKCKQQMKMERESLVMQIDDLHLSLSRVERDYNRREDMLREEIRDLQQRLQDADGRNDDLTQSVTAATRPLLRQIENLQSTYGAQSTSWERVEKNMTERLAEAQSQLATVTEKERDSTEKLMDLNSRVTAQESQIATLRQEKSRLSAELQMEKTKMEHLEDAKFREEAQLENIKANLIKENNDLKKDKVLLQNEMEMEKLKLETEKKKVTLAHEQLKEKEIQLSRAQSPGLRMSASVPGPLDRMSVSSFDRRSSNGSEQASPFMSASMNASQDEILERTLMLASSNGNKTNLYETLRHAGGATLVESLESQLKLRDGEIVQLQTEISELERTRESMSKELVNMQTSIDKMEIQLRDFLIFKAKYQELEQRYDALLQMYGEKVEEAEELQLDLQDVKDMYKQQIQELVRSA